MKSFLIAAALIVGTPALAQDMPAAPAPSTTPDSSATPPAPAPATNAAPAFTPTPRGFRQPAEMFADGDRQVHPIGRGAQEA
jgi:hypothetical protein